MIGYQDAQQAVLGSILIDSRCLPSVVRIARAEHFEGINRYLYGLISGMFVKSQPVDPVLVMDAAKQGECPVAPDTLRNYIMQLMEITPTAANAERYAAIVRDYAKVGQIHTAAAEMRQLNDLQSLRAKLHQTAEAAMDRRASDTIGMDKALAAFYERCNSGRSWLPWPFGSMSKCLFVRPGDYILLGAESSVGKTAMALQLGTYWASRGKRVAFFSLETDEEDLTDRMVAGFLGVDMERILRNELTDVQYGQLAHISSSIARLPFGIVNASGMTAADIAARALTDRAEVVIIDYLQLITPSVRNQGREREIANISLELKNFGRQSGVTVLVLAQLNRSSGELIPTLDRIRDSGQPRQDADVAFLLFRKKDENGNDDPAGRRVLHAAKNKRGETKHITLAFDGPSQLFYSVNAKGPTPLFRLPSLEQMEI